MNRFVWIAVESLSVGCTNNETTQRRNWLRMSGLWTTAAAFLGLGMTSISYVLKSITLGLIKDRTKRLRAIAFLYGQLVAHIIATRVQNVTQKHNSYRKTALVSDVELLMFLPQPFPMLMLFWKSLLYLVCVWKSCSVWTSTWPLEPHHLLCLVYLRTCWKWSQSSSLIAASWTSLHRTPLLTS